MVSVETVSTTRLKSGVEEICSLYCWTPRRGSQASRTCVLSLSVRAFTGSPIVRVNDCVAEYAPGIVPVVSFGNSARTRQWKTPVPVILMNDATGVRKFSKVSCVPSGLSIVMSYDAAPCTGAHDQTGSASPLVAFVALGTGAASFFWNVPVADQVRPVRFSSSARTRQ